MSDDYKTAGEMDWREPFQNLKPRSDAEIAEYEARQREKHGLARWQRCLVPARHKQVLDSGRWVSTADLARNEKVIAQLPDGYVVGLFGTRGTGKTQFAVKVLRERCLQDRSARYVTVPDLTALIKDTWDDGVKLTQEQALAPYKRCSLLVLDEIGERKGGDWDSELITRLVDTRYREMLDTILIGNVEAAKLNETLPSVMRRIYETSGVIAMNSPILKIIQGAA